MKRRAFLLVSGGAICGVRLLGQASAASAAAVSITAGDVILRAMRDELERSRQLSVASGGIDDKPYFIAYSLDDADNFTTGASFGATTTHSRGRFRSPLIEVRVGDYDFDNTGHVYSGIYQGTRFDTAPLPLDNDYQVLREAFWLGTDYAFKAAVDSIGRKRAALNTAAASSDKLSDFARAQPVEYLAAPAKSNVDEAALTARVARLSAIFNNFPSVLASGVELHANEGTSYLVNSEGSNIRYADNGIWMWARAEGQAPDGMLVRQGWMAVAAELSGLPSEAEAAKQLISVAEHIQALVKAPAGEQYTGPVLFEPEAGAQLLAQLVGSNVRQVRKPVTDPGRPANFGMSEYEGRIGLRVLPEIFDVVDDPTLTTWNGSPLMGNYPVDFEGVKPRAVSLIEKGVLKTYLSTRQPTKNSTASNGHARFPGGFGTRSAAISNLIVKARETTSQQELKARLIQLCKDQDRPYGMLIRKLDYPFSAGNAELQALQTTNGRIVSPPVLAYKVYADGREQLVRGLRFAGMNWRSLRDILAASTETAIFSYINNGAPLARTGVGGYIALTSVVAPGLLFDELELERGQDQLEKPAIVPPPNGR